VKKRVKKFLNNIFINNYAIVTAGIIIAVLSIFIILSIYKQSKQNIINEFQKYQLTSVESAARGIEGFIKNIIKDLCFLGQLRSAQNMDLTSVRSTLENLYFFSKEEDSFLTSLFYFDNQGALKFVIPSEGLEEGYIQTEIDRAECSFKSSEADKFYISKLFFNHQEEGRIRISVPIVAQVEQRETGEIKFLGTLAADIDVEKMAHYFIGHVNINTSYVCILDKDGCIIDHPCPQFITKNIRDIDIKRIDEDNRVYPFYDSQDFLDILLKKKRGAFRVISPNFGRLELLSYAPVQLYEKYWIVTKYTPFSEISGPVGELQRRFTVIMLGLIILMTIGSFLLVTVNKKRVRTETRVKHLTREIQLEEEIKKSEAKSRAILQSINDCIIILDRDLNIIWSNDSDEKKFIGKKCWQIRRGLHQPCSKCIVKESFADNKSHLSEVVGQDNDQRFSYQMCSSPILDNEGKVVSVVEMTRDISNMRKMDVLIRESEERYRHLIEQMNEGLLIIDSENGITFVNNKFCKLFSCESKEIVGQNYGVLLNPESQIKMKEAVDRSKKGKPSLIELERGDSKASPLSMICSLSSLFDERRNYRGTSVVFTEITERKKLEKEIQVSRDKLRAILKGLSDGVMIIDKNYILQYMNESSKKIFKDQVQKLCYQALWGRSEPCQICLLKQIFEKKQDQYLTKDSIKGRILDISGSPLVMEDESISMLMVFRDITERKYLEDKLLEFEKKRLQDHKETCRFDKIIGKNHKMQDIYDLISIVSQGLTTVLIQGASGTGKELIARAIHYDSAQHDKPFIGVSCSALSDGLLESELFGHVRGAFTNAVRDKMGRFELADGGTLFLDEIGDISPFIQVKLLRVLQERQFERVGSLKTIRVNVRVIAATNKDLKTAVAKGEFREDLYYRLNVVKIYLPSLKEKIDDIPNLVNHFIEQFNKKFKRNISSLSSTAMGDFVSYDWPGNVRQLENAIEHAFICAKGKIILPQDLPPEIRQGEKQKKRSSMVDIVDSEQGKEAILTLDEMEAQMIVNGLRQTDGHLGNTAQVLGIARSTLWRLMKKHNITKESGRNKKVVFLKEKFNLSKDHGHNSA